MLIKKITVLIILIFSSIVFSGCDLMEEILIEFTVDREKLATPVLLQEISMEELPKALFYKFFIDYSGKYTAYILLSTNKKYAAGKNYDSNFRMQLTGKINIKDEKDEILKTETIAWNFGYGFEGQSFMVFKSPDEIPKKENLYCEIEYLEASDKLNERFDSVKLVIKRLGSFLD